MPFPKCSYCFVSSFDIVFTRGVVVFFSCILGCLHFSEGLLLSGLPVASILPQPYSFLCTKSSFLPNLLSFKCLCATPGRRQTSQHQPGEDPHLSCSMWSTFTKAFDVSTSSALNVNSSEFSLTITSGHPSSTFGFRLEMFPCPGSKIQHQGRAHCQPYCINASRS